MPSTSPELTYFGQLFLGLTYLFLALVMLSNFDWCLCKRDTRSYRFELRQNPPSLYYKGETVLIRVRLKGISQGKEKLAKEHM